MIENKSLRSKIFDILNIVILIAITLICIVPVWYVLCVSLSNREAVNAGKVALWPVGFNLLSYKKIMGETAFFGSFLVSIKRVLLGTGISMVCILMAAYPLSRTKKQFPKRDIFMWIFVFCMLFNGGTVPWYITMKNYHLMDNIFGLVLGTGLQVFNVILVSLLVGGSPLVNDKYVPVYNAYNGQTKTMEAKWANLKKMEEETFSKIIMGKADISEFDTFVENWKNQGGDQILKEINDELSK